MHPMGRSAEYVGHSSAIENYNAGSNKPLKAGEYELRIAKTTNGFVHRMTARIPSGTPVPEYTVAGNLSIGSGTRGRSYLSMEKGAVWQSPLSWFSAKSRWDLFPDFEPVSGGRWPVHTDCLFCHVDRVEPVPQSLNRYKEPLLPLQVAIGCERCHGPGALHVNERKDGLVPDKVDTSIVNPKRLTPELRASVCEQCHLQGQERVARRGRNVFEYRPGLPFEQFVTVFVRHPDAIDPQHTGGQFEQVEQSRCFTASAGRLACTTCHDPHQTPAAAARDGFYRGRCLTCHESKGCSAPAAERAASADSCISCHMPRGSSTNIAHASVTDHRIARRTGALTLPQRLAPGAAPLVAFRTGPNAPPAAERERDLGIVLARLTAKIPANASATRAGVAQMAVERLAGSLTTWRGDADAWIALAAARGALGEATERWEAATKGYRLAPNSEAAAMELAEAALATGKLDQAVQTSTKLIEMNPTAVGPLLIRSIAFIRQREWGKAESDARIALTLYPLHPQARLYLAVSRHHLGDAEEARKEVETAAELSANPHQREAMLDWFRRETR